MAFGFGSPTSANQLAALGAMQGILPSGNPLQSVAPVIPGYQGPGGGMMGRMMPMMPGAPQRPQQGQAQGQIMQGLMNPQLMAMLKKQFAPNAGGIPGGSGSFANWLGGGTGSLTGGDVSALQGMYGPGMGAGVSPY